MKLFAALRGAVLGWRAIVVGHADWERHFALTPAGLVTALVSYLLVAFLALLYGAGLSGQSPIGLAIGLLVFSLYVLAVAVSIILTRLVLNWRGSILKILVPGIYALVAFLIVGAALSSLMAPLIALALVLAGFLLFRLGRVAGPWSVGVAAAFAVFTVALLVATPFSLYMLTGPEISAV